MSDSLQPHGLQHARLPCPSQSPGVCPSSCPLNGWCIQLSHPLSPPSPFALSLSQHQGLFQWVSSSHQVAKVLEFQLHHQSFQWVTIFQLKKKKGAGECGIDHVELGHLSSGWNARHQPFCITEILQILSAVRWEHLIIFNSRAGECVLTQACFLTLPMDGQLDQLWTNVHTEVEQIWKRQEKLMSHKIYPETACKWVWHSFSL